MSDTQRQTRAWVLYDWANSAFYTTVMAGFFPIFFKSYWSAGADATESTLYLGSANSFASLMIVLLSPIAGAIADRSAAKVKLLTAFMLAGVVATAGLYFIASGQWVSAALCYAAAVVCAEMSIVFYNALLVDISDVGQRNRLSAQGFAFGYLGGGVLFAINVLMTLQPGLFGLADAAEGVRLSFVMVAMWWLLFSLPIVMFVKERPSTSAETVSIANTIAQAFSALSHTAREARQYRSVWLFLLAYFFYIDGVHTVIMMAVDYGLSLGFAQESLIVALLITQFVGFPAALVFGRLGDRFGAARGIFIGVAIYALGTVLAVMMSQTWHFYAMAVLIGLVQGGVQALSRAYYSELIPEHKAAEFFGFYNMLGKAAAIFGPLMVGIVSYSTNSPRLGILSLLLLFALGMVFLLRIDARAED